MSSSEIGLASAAVTVRWGHVQPHPCRRSVLTFRPGPSAGEKQFYFSWEDGTQKYTWEEADKRCSYRGMRLVSLENPEKDYYISSQIDKYSM